MFWAPEIDVGKPAPFQLSLMAPRQIPIDSLPFSSLSIYLSHKDEPVIVQHQDSDIFSDSLIQNVALGRISSSVPSEVVLANLRWKAGSAVIFWGTISSDVPTCLKVNVPDFKSLIQMIESKHTGLQARYHTSRGSMEGRNTLRPLPDSAKFASSL